MVFRLLFLITLFYSCNNNRTIVLDDSTKAVGDISSDTVYNGLIKFYDSYTNKLLKEYFYKNGLREGAATEYYKNGKVAVKLSFENDKRNGYSFYYDDFGKLIQKDFFYYDILVGPSYNYNERVYKFYSLDGKELLVLSYPSLKSAKSITDLIESYFFFHTNDYYIIADDTRINPKTEYFLYTPNPPELDFKYSLVEVDNQFEVVKTFEDFSQGTPWVRFTLPEVRTGNQAAIQLKIKDVDGRTLNLFKGLSKL